MNSDKEKYMQRALELAERGRGFTSPNPVVGCVIVKDGVVIGEGYHERYGELHAERNALAACTENPEGADMYVTLEPCCHYGKTPPCTEAVIEAGIGRVFVGAKDPNPLVAGKGIEILRAAGIEVVPDVMKDECEDSNRVFFHYMRSKMPYATLKYAMTSDGKIATKTGKSKWITCSDAREYVHKLRSDNMAILAGIGTVIADDPMLNSRIDGGKNPIRIICDTHLRIPEESQIVKTAGQIKTVICTGDESLNNPGNSPGDADEPDRDANCAACGASDSSTEASVKLFEDNPVHDTGKAAKAKRLEDAGCSILKAPLKNGHIDLEYVFKTLGEMGIDSVLVEGGSEIAYSLLEAGLVQRILVFIAPKIFGGMGKSPVSGAGVSEPSECYALRPRGARMICDDILIEYDVIWREGCSPD